MGCTEAVKKMKKAMMKEYGKEKGTSVAYATAHKRDMRIKKKKPSIPRIRKRR